MAIHAAARVLALAAAGVGVLLLLIWMGQRRMIYFPFGTVPAPADVGLFRAAKVTFPTDDGLTLNGWFVPAERPGADTVIVFNGNAGNRAYRSDLAAWMATAGMAVLLFDYRGYAENPGSPSEEGLALDARAARRYVLSRHDVDPRRLVYFGESLGSGWLSAWPSSTRRARSFCVRPSRRSWTSGACTIPSCLSPGCCGIGIRQSIALGTSRVQCSSSQAPTTPSFQPRRVGACSRPRVNRNAF